MSAPPLALDDYQPAAGDLLGFAAPWDDAVGALIKVATLSRVTHIAGVARLTRELIDAENARRWAQAFQYPELEAAARLRWPALDEPIELLIESTTLCHEPCLLQGRSVRGVQAHGPGDRIEQYLSRGGRAWLYRPAVDWQLFGREKDLLAEFLLMHVGDSYDYQAAAASAELIFKRRWWWRTAHAHSCFCSYVWDAALQRIGRLGATDASGVNPGGLLRTVTKIGRYQLVGEFR